MKLIIFGTAPDVHVKYDSPYVSGYHAEMLLLDNGDILLTDKASRNGTFVNDMRISPNKEVTVNRGDNIRFADTALDWNSVPPQQSLKGIKEIRGIGTNFRNKYQLQGDRVSRFHATLKLKNDKKWYIQDHSKNGTSVNGVPVVNNQEVQLKKHDRIQCAGIDVPNPYTGKIETGTSKGPSASGIRKWILRGVGIAALVALAIFGINRLIDRSGGGKLTPDPPISENMTDADIYAKYKDAIVMIYGFYYYKISAGDINLTEVGLPTEVVVSTTESGRSLKVVHNVNDMNSYTATGFFVSSDGKIVTNLHVAKPWLFSEDMQDIADLYKRLLTQNIIQSRSSQQRYVLQLIKDDLKVEGVCHQLGFIPNGEFVADDNLVGCRVLAAGDNTNIDVAILQSNKRRLPLENTNVINLEEAVVADSNIRVGEHIYTMGFPFGPGAQDLESSMGINLLGHAGNITQECTEYSFGFDAASFGGASGSPIFNSKGQLVGVLNRGSARTQGFNYAVKAVYATELYNETVRHR